MGVKSTLSCRGRAVILSGDHRLTEPCRLARLKCVRVGSAYEAAAELLAAPAVALILDLRLLPVGHLRLLDIARQMGLDMFAVGVVDAAMTAEELSGLRIVSCGDLPQLLQAAAQVQVSDLAPPPAAATSDEVRTPVKAEKPAPTAAEKADSTRGTYVSNAVAKHARAAGGAEKTGEPLLTPEELDALLRNEP